MFSKFPGDPSDSFWFVLTPKTLTCYKSAAENEDEKLLSIPLDGLKMRQSDGNVITLYNPSGQDVHPDYKELELLCKSTGKLNSWLQSFSKALNKDESVSFCN